MMTKQQNNDTFDIYDLLLEQIRDIYDGELQQIDFFNELSDSTNSFELNEFLQYHLRETERQTGRIESVLEELAEVLSGESCDGIKGLIKETRKLAKRCLNDEVCDAAIVTAIQHINHYEMAGYGTAIAYAKALERHEIAEQLLETLREEKRADMGLSDLAENQINSHAKWSAIVEKIEPRIGAKK